MKRLFWIVGIGIVLAIAAICALINIQEVRVTGNLRYTEEEIENLVFPDKLSRNSTYCFFHVNIFGNKEIIPFVEDYEVLFESPSKVDIIVYEKSVVAYVKYMGSYMYFDKDGYVVDSSVQALEDLPEITGLQFGSIVLYRKLPVKEEKIFEEILNLTQVLKINNIHPERIHFSEKREATLYLGDIRVMLGSSDSINGKILELKDILPEIQGMCGTLYIDSYDSDSGTATYTFQKN